MIAKSLFSAKRHDWIAVAGTKENENSFSAGIPAGNSVQEILSPTWSREKVVKVGWLSQGKNHPHMVWLWASQSPIRRITYGSLVPCIWQAFQREEKTRDQRCVLERVTESYRIGQIIYRLYIVPKDPVQENDCRLWALQRAGHRKSPEQTACIWKMGTKYY